jgi:hypothetical protein
MVIAVEEKMNKYIYAIGIRIKMILHNFEIEVSFRQKDKNGLT